MRYRVSYLIVPETLKRNDAEALETKAYRAASFGLDPLKQSAAVSMAAAMGMYERVVNLDADNLEDVFRLCNSIDKCRGIVIADVGLTDMYADDPQGGGGRARG